ncbi:MAG: tyrosine-type recombinase/integrase [Terrimicrobiaceae bacterium]
MACVWKHPSLKTKYWIARFTDATGRRVNRSTKQTDRKKAQAIADSWEKARGLATKHELTRAAATKVLSELMEQVGMGTFHESSIADFLRGWLKQREADGYSPATAKRYKSQIDGVIAFLGPNRSKGSVASLTATEIEEWRDAETESGKSAKTVNLGIGTIRAALAEAMNKGFVTKNEAKAAKLVRGETDERKPFTPEELKALIRTDNLEWRRMIALGCHTGMRLTDAANLTWGSIDQETKTISFTPQKTKKKIVVAMHEELVTTLGKLTRGIGKAPLFPSLHGRKPGSSGGLSNQFAAIMKTTGVLATLGVEKEGKGRQTRDKSFHSLRHTFVSRLANADISRDVRKKMAGHASDRAHDHYTHLELAAQRAALAKIEAIG